MDKASKNSRDFYRVATYSTCIGFAALGGVLGSMREITETFRMEFSFRTIVCAAIGALAGWALWKFFRFLADREQKRARF